MWCREEMEERKGAVVGKKGKRERSTQGNTRGEHVPKATGLENGLHFVSSYNQGGLKPEVLKGSGLGSKLTGQCPAPGEKAGEQPRGIQHGNRYPQNA